MVSPTFTQAPSALIQSVKVISPVEIESIAIPFVGLDILITTIPWHSIWLESFTPSTTVVQCPEVHEEMLFLIQGVNICGVFNLTDQIAINMPSDVIRCPLKLVIVPQSVGMEVFDVRLVILLSWRDDVCAEWVVRHRWYDLNVNLVPARYVFPRWPFPIREEGGDSSGLVVDMHGSLEFSILESFHCFDFTASPFFAIGKIEDSGGR